MEGERIIVEEHPEDCSCGCGDLETEDYLRNIVNAQKENDCMKREFSQCDCPLCKEEHMEEATKTEEATVDEQSYVNKAREFVEDIPKTVGEYAGKLAWLLAKPFDQIHKHTSEPFIDAFKEHFGNGK